MELDLHLRRFRRPQPETERERQLREQQQAADSDSRIADATEGLFILTAGVLGRVLIAADEIRNRISGPSHPSN